MNDMKIETIGSNPHMAVRVMRSAASSADRALAARAREANAHRLSLAGVKRRP